MKITDEQLMAYADGELDAEARRHIDAALASDPALAAALEKHRRLRRRVNEAFDPILAERVPDRLVSTLKANPTVVELATSPQVRAARASMVVAGMGRNCGKPDLGRYCGPKRLALRIR